MSEKANKHVYLDYSATTPVKDEVLQEMLPFFTQDFGNPSSLYSTGQQSKKAISLARNRLASLINCDSSEIFFTSSGTEADNWALIMYAMSNRKKGNHIITTKIEHHAILHSAEYLENEGFDVTYLDVDNNGFVEPDALKNAITDKTILISIMFANNEIGTIEPIKELASIAKDNNIIFHTDAVQALGNTYIDVKDLGVDMMSMSAHKIYGPKGIGALYIRKGVRLPSFIHGGGQESKKRAGTENLTGIIGFGKAAELADSGLDEHIDNITKLRNYFIDRILNEVTNCHLNGDKNNRLPGNANITFEKIEGEAILLHLDMKGIEVSTGSACSSASLTPSHVLEAIGVPVEEIYGTVRFSIGDFTTKEDIDYTIDTIKEIVIKLRNMP